MKFHIDIECTPEEARLTLGLPDVRPVQEMMMKEMEERMRKGLAAMDPEQIMKLWMPSSLEGWENMQKLFWSQFGSALRAAASTERK
jgi:hypothetical protein